MDEDELVFNFLFFLFCYFLFVYPTVAFSAFYFKQLFSKELGTEAEQFVEHHQKRICLTFLVHASMPNWYFLIYYVHFKHPHWLYALCPNLSGIITFVTMLCVFYFWRNKWENHPISRQLKKYANNDGNWRQVATSLNDEFRRDTKVSIKMNAISTVIVTENWIIKTSLYSIDVAHQSDTALIAVKSDTHTVNHLNELDSVQFVNIIVQPTRLGVNKFNIRINALDFKSLQDRINRPITILSGVTFNRSVMEQFVEVFKEEIARNAKFNMSQTNVNETDTCFACLQVQPNVKIQKQCLDIDENNMAIPNDKRCTNCFCRPMWCVDCLAMWFASRQSEHSKNVWLEQKCTCPMCRASFCILDVCFIENNV